MRPHPQDGQEQVYQIFYHDVFPTLNVMQFGGAYPWGSADEAVLECPDRQNLVTIRIRRG